MDNNISEQPLICANCRQINPANSRYCNLCGNPLSGDVDLASESRAQVMQQPPPAPSGQVGYYPPTRKPKSKLTAILASIGLFLFLTPILMGVGAFGGCLAIAATGQDSLITPFLIIGLLASIAISVLVFRSMTTN